MNDGSHRLRRMRGRDPSESGRVSTPLELLYDLTFVVAFGQAGSQWASALVHDQVGGGLAAFTFATFAVAWAWINFSWFASAYDTDDWAFRLLTMVQMVGVVVLTLGLPEMFASVQTGRHLDTGLMVTGYVVMRVSMCGLWLRAWRQDPARRRVAVAHLLTIVVAQALWCALVFVPTPAGTTFALAVVPLLVELSGPILAATRLGGIPWHPHHIAERYGLLTIITLGEGVIGTIAVIDVLAHDPDVGWSVDSAVVLAAGVLLTFGLWWTYFMIPWAAVLRHQRSRALPWGYAHIPLFGAIVAIGSGLHAGADHIHHTSNLGATATVTAVAVPIGVYCLLLYALYAVFARARDPFHLTLIALTVAILLSSVVLAASGVGLVGCLAVVAFAPLVTVVGYETIGHRHVQDHLARLATAHSAGSTSSQSSSNAMLS